MHDKYGSMELHFNDYNKDYAIEGLKDVAAFNFNGSYFLSERDKKDIEEKKKAQEKLRKEKGDTEELQEVGGESDVYLDL